MSKAIQTNEPESLNQTKDRIQSDIEELEEALIDLNLMMVVDPNDNDKVGETTVKFGDGMDTNGPVFSELQNHPVHVDKIYSHGVMFLEHDDVDDYRTQKRESY